MTEWDSLGQWHNITIQPAIKDDKQNLTGRIIVKLNMIAGHDKLYIAARWPDENPDINYRNWKWRNNRYYRGKDRDDMFAIRFELSGEYQNTMLSAKQYQVDLWLWSAGRSNLAGYANDMSQLFSPEPIENAAKHTIDGKTFYIKKFRDKGNGSYQYIRLNKEKYIGDTITSVQVTTPTASQADIKAKGRWNNGFWQLEMARKLDTNNPDDVSFKNKESIRGAIAVFNRSYGEHKSNSGTINFHLPVSK